VDEPGLANPRLARHEDNSGAALTGSARGSGERGKLLLPPHERIPASHASSVAFVRFARCSREPLVIAMTVT
jgi:hypothetical protein